MFYQYYCHFCQFMLFLKIYCRLLHWLPFLSNFVVIIVWTSKFTVFQYYCCLSVFFVLKICCPFFLLLSPLSKFVVFKFIICLDLKTYPSKGGKKIKSSIFQAQNINFMLNLDQCYRFQKVCTLSFINIIVVFESQYTQHCAFFILKSGQHQYRVVSWTILSCSNPFANLPILMMILWIIVVS